MSKMEEVELLQDEEKHESCGKTRKAIIIGGVFAVILFIIFLIINHFSTNSVSKSSAQIVYIPPPSKYVISDEWSLPPWDDKGRLNSSVFSILSILEASYRKQGIDSGYLDKQQYVRFSPDYFVAFFDKKCKDSNFEICKNAGSFTFLDYVKLLNHFSDSYKSLVPLEACPYSEKAVDCFNSITETVLEDNPLVFKINSAKYGTTIDRIKEMFYEKQGPIAFSLPMPILRYWYGCDFSNEISSTEWCQRGTASAAPVDYKWSDTRRNGEIHISTEIAIDKAREMVLVGYDDNYVEELECNITGEPAIRGAFILQNSIGSSGYSLEYFAGEISSGNEAALCPNIDDPMNWVPLDINCAAAYGAAGILDGSCPVTKLECIDETGKVCDPQFEYYVIAEPYSRVPVIQYNLTGVNVPVIAYSDGSNISYPETFRHYPYEMLNKAFRAKINAKNDQNHCGHMIVSYKLIDELMKLSGPQTDSIGAISIDVKWSPESFAKYKKRGSSYSLTKKSTSSFTRNRFATHYVDL